ncbi:hypothetical protein TNCV_3902561 [Trichonephila clavipes]|nr:hypothetical protein TNCV_3902561 [Trichonephila clavipes]
MEIFCDSITIYKKDFKNLLRIVWQGLYAELPNASYLVFHPSILVIILAVGSPKVTNVPLPSGLIRDAKSQHPHGNFSLYLQSLVYADKPQTLDQLEDKIRRVIADIRPQMLEKVIENWTSRLDYIRASRGSPMPEIICKM